MKKKLTLLCVAFLLVCSSFALTTQATAEHCYDCGGGGGGKRAKALFCSKTRFGNTYYGWKIICITGGATCTPISCTA